MSINPPKLITIFAMVFFLAKTSSAQIPRRQWTVEDPRTHPLTAEMDDKLNQNRGMSFEELRRKHNTQYESEPDFDVSTADYYDEFVESFGLGGKARDALDRLGFVVVQGPSTSSREIVWNEEQGHEMVKEVILPAGPTDVYYRVFAADLPVFISADSILHAWHRSFENKMMEKEEEFYNLMDDLLDGAIGQLDPTIQPERDAMFYLSVARALADYDWDDNLDWQLDPEDRFVPHDSVKMEVKRFLSLIETRQLKRVNFLGTPTWIDFSQFTQRGHYTRTRILTKYFMVLTWLSSIDLVLYHPETGIVRPREEAAARRIVKALHDSDGFEEYETIASFYSKVVGSPAAMTPVNLLVIMNQTNSDNLVTEYQRSPLPAYLSRALESHNPPLTMRFFPKRFAYDAWVTAQTTTPELEPNIIGGRSMAMDMDVAFALGSDRALDYLEEDMIKPLRQNLPATLESVRQVFDSIKPTELEDTVYNHWLEAIAALSKPTTDPEYPRVLRTGPWHDRKLEAALSSWAELRHDTVLIVEQSMGGSGCQYPKGYVEPVPELYRSLGRAAALMGLEQEWKPTMETLASLCEKELSGKSMNDEELQFLNQTVDMHRDRYTGDRMYTGWYPRLIYRDNGEKSEPVISDVHTDADYRRVLQVGVGHPGLMIVAIDNNGDRSLYGGPVYNYYSFTRDIDHRMNDKKWKKLLKKRAPQKPAFTYDYWVLDNPTTSPPDKPSSKGQGRPGLPDFDI